MAVTDGEVAALRAVLKDDVDQHKELFAELDRGHAAKAYTALISSAFVDAVWRRFGENRASADVVQFVADVRSRSEGLAAKIDPETGERLIGTVLGEASTAGLSREAKMSGQFLLLVALMAAERLDDDGLDAFLANARTGANELLAG
jgi:hypothetical protein